MSKFTQGGQGSGLFGSRWLEGRGEDHSMRPELGERERKRRTKVMRAEVMEKREHSKPDMRKITIL